MNSTNSQRALRTRLCVSCSPYVNVPMSDEAIIDLYERHAREFDRDRGRALQEKAWLDRFLGFVPPSGTILDIGCGMAEPIANYFIQSGRQVVGVDSSPSMIDLCRSRFPRSEWRVADMRELALGRRFDGIVAWDSFFHLSMADQRGMFPRFAAHARTGAPLLFTSGSLEGEAIGSCLRRAPVSLEPESLRIPTAARGKRILGARLPGRRSRLRRSHRLAGDVRW